MEHYKHLACNKADARRCPIFIPPEKYRLLLKLQEEERKRETEGKEEGQAWPPEGHNRGGGLYGLSARPHLFPSTKASCRRFSYDVKLGESVSFSLYRHCLKGGPQVP